MGWPGGLLQGRYVVYRSVSDVKSFHVFFAAGLFSLELCSWPNPPSSYGKYRVSIHVSTACSV